MLASSAASTSSTAGTAVPLYFTDITQGNNRSGSRGAGFIAKSGWDACTGLGVPIGTQLLASLRENGEGSLAYLLSLPVEEKGYRTFCAWSLFLGAASLSWIEKRFELKDGMRHCGSSRHWPVRRDHLLGYLRPDHGQPCFCVCDRNSHTGPREDA